MMDASMDFTTEDQVYWSGNSEEASRDSYLEAIEELEEVLQKLNETYGTRSPAAPEPKPYVPPTAHEEDSPEESMQNEDPTIEDLVQASGNSKEVSRYSYLQTVEQIKAFLQEADETHKARTPAAPEPEFRVPPTAREEDDRKESMQREDFTTEDQVYWSGNSEEASRDSYLEAIEELEEVLQKLNETYGTRSPAAPEPKPYVPPTAHEEDSPEESMQNEDPTIEDLVQASGNSKEVSRYSYLQTVEQIKAFLQEADETHKARTPAAPEPEFHVPLTAREEDDRKESMQRQKPTTEDLVQLSSTSKDASMPSFFVTLEDIEEFLHEVNEIHEAKTPPVPESELCVPLTAHDEVSQMESMNNQVTSFDERTPTGASQLMDVTDTPMTFITDCQVKVVNANKRTISNEGSKVKTLNDDQSLCGGQMTIIGDQTLYGGQMKSPTECQNLSGTQMTFAADKTIYGNQMETMDEHQTFSVGQMNFSGDQTLYGGQTKTVSDDTLHEVHIMPQSSSSSSYPRVLYVASSHLIQGQPVEMHKWNPKIQRCPLQKRPDILRPYICTYNCGKAYAKSSHLRIHERVHTGEKPYKCDVNGCTWAFSRSDELHRHKKRHTRERPYLCTICNKDFARSDHLQQHQRVHRRTSPMMTNPAAFEEMT